MYEGEAQAFRRRASAREKAAIDQFTVEYMLGHAQDSVHFKRILNPYLLPISHALCSRRTSAIILFE
jgi:hypothetical protein